MIIQLISKFPAVVEFAISSNFSTKKQLDSVPQLFGLLVVDFITTISAFYRSTLHCILHACSLPCLRHPSLFNNQGLPHTKKQSYVNLAKMRISSPSNCHNCSFIRPFICSSIYPSTQSFIHPSIHPSIH